MQPPPHPAAVRYLRLTGRPPLSATPEAFRLLAASEHVSAARAVATKFAGTSAMSVLFHVDGDRRAVEARLDGPPEIVVAETAPGGEDGFYLLLVLDPESIPLLRAVFEALPWQELVVVPPIVYRDGAVHAQLVGATGAVSGLVDSVPDAVDVEVHAVGERGLDVAPGSAVLSDRQREAVLAALDLGYYDQPRRATHEDVAETLDCAASTASEHLQKAEAKLVRVAIQ